MKKMLMILVSLFIVSGGVYAQDQTQKRDKTQKQDRIHQEDHLQFENGTLYQVKEGVRTQLQTQLRLKDGTLCNPDGTCTLQNQTQLRLRNGECLDMEGNRYMNQSKFNKRKMMTERQTQKSQTKVMKQKRTTNPGRGAGNKHGTVN